MRLLAFDTTAERLSLALDDGKKIRRKLCPASRNQDELLPREVDKLLAAATLKLSDVDAFVAAAGPGRFTGIRVGLTFAGVLAKSLGKKALGVSWLEACVAKDDGAGTVAVVVPGWRGEFFFQVFHAGRALQPPRWSGPRELEDKIDADLAGREAQFLRPARLEAADLLPAARARLASGDLGELAPLYIKPPHYDKT